MDGRGSEPTAGHPAGTATEFDRRELAGHLRREFEATARLARRVADDLLEPIGRLAELVLETLDRGGRLFFCGNGGSAADAQHLAAEYMVRYRRRRGALPALALTSDTSVLTAGGNDLGFEQVFARQIEGLGRAGDLLILHSTSGDSPNLIEAVRAARSAGMRTVALLASGGGELSDRVEVAIVVPTDVRARAQEMHMVIEHAVAAWVDEHWPRPEGTRDGGSVD